MKNKTKLLILFAMMLILPFVITACGISGPSNSVYLISYRYANGSMELPIKVQKRYTDPNPARYFKSKWSLDEIYDALCASDDFYAEYHQSVGNDFVLAKDISANNSGYCLIYKEYHEKFNYVATNMQCRIYSAKSEINRLGFLIPLHWLPTSSIISEDLSIVEGLEYKTNASIDDFAAFYREYDFEVTIDQNKLLLEDTIGKGGYNPVDSIACACEIQFEDGIVRFVNFASKEQSHEM